MMEERRDLPRARIQATFAPVLVTGKEAVVTWGKVRAVVTIRLVAAVTAVAIAIAVAIATVGNYMIVRTNLHVNVTKHTHMHMLITTLTTSMRT